MKEAILMTVEGRAIPAKKEFAKCFHEMTAVLGYPVQEGWVADDVTLPELDDVIAMMNGTKEVKVVEFTTDRPAQVAAPAVPAAVAEEEDTAQSEAVGAFAGLTDTDRANLLKNWVQQRLLRNEHPLEGCADNEVRVGKVFEHWGTGLSRGSISRHVNKVVEELETNGHSIFRGAGRYQLLRNR